MEMIERYIYAVTKRLPSSQREDIAQELRGLIEDLLEEKIGNNAVTDDAIEEVLTELGSPVELAAKYRGTKRYLISPDLFLPYSQMLKIILFSILIAMITVFAIETIIQPTSVVQNFVAFIGSVINISAQAFAWVTIGFAVAEYFGKVPRELNFQDEKWKPSDLPPIPDPKNQIKRGETLFGIIFYILFAVYILFSNQLFGVPIFKNDELITIIPFLNADAFQGFIVVIYGLIVTGILKESLKLVIGKWTKKLAVYNFLLNGVTLGLIAILLKEQSIWNPNFMQDLAQFSDINATSEAYSVIKDTWERSHFWIVTAFSIGLIVDTVIGFYKAFKK
ncbi:hypothetical protein GCM10011351_25510 [Paraliobacillus quinghaiensis]|uniref:Uncharacterized protein n=1 Tax=Paraliobacillus quinghaiensis TaxID=470815 RepID=A0A917TW19_9BACI|nr:permease prefix domain 1-containing protein [Paraliobacillus quinghaiensis]GGM38258.1 hypothetical protein GCM10011351_25510 [Paraliobacillus quinghaiensis]